MSTRKRNEHLRSVWKPVLIQHSLGELWNRHAHEHLELSISHIVLNVELLLNVGLPMRLRLLQGQLIGCFLLEAQVVETA